MFRLHLIPYGAKFDFVGREVGTPWVLLQCWLFLKKNCSKGFVI
jgi:hypothetical protein